LKVKSVKYKTVAAGFSKTLSLPKGACEVLRTLKGAATIMAVRLIRVNLCNTC